MAPDLPPLPERDRLTPEQFAQDIQPAGEPVVIRGLAAHWPAVALAGDHDALGDYLRRGAGAKLHDPVDVMRAHESVGGRFFYDAADMGRFNFQQAKVPFSAFLDRLLGGTDGEAVYMGSNPAPAVVPDIVSDFALDLVPGGTVPRLWIGNRSVVSTHNDHSSNIACVVAGTRTFTLFPPEQVGNLYVGPIEHNMAGSQTSLVDLHAPDLERHPRFTEALASARSATLYPGDAIYIPPLWWHDVRADNPLSVLVNFWWDHRPEISRVPMEAFVLATLALRQLPAPERRAWQALFDHFIFEEDGPAMAHLPDEHRGVLGPINPERANALWAFFRKLMTEG